MTSPDDQSVGDAVDDAEGQWRLEASALARGWPGAAGMISERAARAAWFGLVNLAQELEQGAEHEAAMIILGSAHALAAAQLARGGAARLLALRLPVLPPFASGP